MNHSRREFLKSAFALLFIFCFGKFLDAELLIGKRRIYKINNQNCIACGSCASACIRQGVPAIQAVNYYKKCGFCKICCAYFADIENPFKEPVSLVCKSKAFIRKYILENRYKYTVDTAKCCGCGACVRLCRDGGKRSLKLYVNQSICLHCVTCSAQKACQNNAFTSMSK